MYAFQQSVCCDAYYDAIIVLQDLPPPKPGSLFQQLEVAAEHVDYGEPDRSIGTFCALRIPSFNTSSGR